MAASIKSIVDDDGNLILDSEGRAILDVFDITTTALTPRIAGIVFSQTLEYIGGAPVVVFSSTALPEGVSLSADGILSGKAIVSGEFSITVIVTDDTGRTADKTFSWTITARALRYGFTQGGVELFVEALDADLDDGATVASLTDISNYGRDLTASSSLPTFQTNEINSKPVIRFDGSQSPLKNSAQFPVTCGWIVTKFDDSEFSAYQGLLSDLVNQTILVSNNSGTQFFDVGYDLFEFRSNDRIYPAENAPAPMGEFKLIFFRFWRPIIVDGIQLGQQTIFTDRKLSGDVPLLILCSRGFCEKDIRARSLEIATAYDLDLADVFPFVPDRDTAETSEQSVNFYDPPEGSRISEVLGDGKRAFQCKFTSRRRDEVKEMKIFHASHYAAAVPCLLRNYNLLPPEDIEGYIDSPYQLNGSVGIYNYGFDFREK